VVSVGLDLVHKRSLSAGAVVDGKLGGLANGKDVHAVNLLGHRVRVRADQPAIKSEQGSSA